MANENYYIGANDEHGVNPPTFGKRTPFVTGLDRQIYENEFNRAAKNRFIEACLRNGFSVYDVKPQLTDLSVSERVKRINSQRLTLLVTFAYNAFGSGNTFNSASGVETYYSNLNLKSSDSKALAEEIYESLITGTPQKGNGVHNIDIGVLSSVNCVSALVEAGYMTNLREAGLMLDPAFQIETGEDTCRGMCRYLGVPFVNRDDLGNYPLLKEGSRGSFVYLLQFILLNYGYTTDIDGVFGENTKSEVIHFQNDNGIAPDGAVGGATWKTLLTLPPCPVLREGSRGTYVIYLQNKLESYFISVGRTDGVFGENTVAAVKKFQEEHNLQADGIVGARTWAALNETR